MKVNKSSIYHGRHISRDVRIFLYTNVCFEYTNVFEGNPQLHTTGALAFDVSWSKKKHKQLTEHHTK